METTPETESNKQIVRRLLDEVVTEGNIDLIDDIFAEDVLDHTLMGDTRGREPIKERAESLHAAFSDFSATAEKLVAEDDTVALWAIDRGTHDGEFLGIEPTGREVEYSATAFFFRMEEMGKSSSGGFSLTCSALCSNSASSNCPETCRAEERWKRSRRQMVRRLRMSDPGAGHRSSSFTGCL